MRTTTPVYAVLMMEARASCMLYQLSRTPSLWRDVLRNIIGGITRITGKRVLGSQRYRKKLSGALHEKLMTD